MRSVKTAAAVLIFFLASLSLFSQEKPVGDGIWAFRYGSSSFPENALFKDGNRAHTVDIAWLFYALRRRGRWILIDTGFDDKEMIKYFNVEWTDPLELLKKAGISPEDVSLVLLTHAHFDHVGLADRFPKARLIMSEAARKDAAAHAVPPAQRDFFKFSRQIDTFRGKIVIDGGITMVEIGGHSPGSSIIRLEADKVIFTGDEAYLPENWTGPRPNGTFVDLEANTHFLESLKDLAAQYLILTMHDPAVVPPGEKIHRLR
jgi:N-acyl homoserine lactone hydrolase